jgi:hypothetical protein
MTLEQAIGELRRAGSLAVVAGAIRYEIRNRSGKTAEAVATIKARKAEALAKLSNSASPQVDALEMVLQGRAIELWSTAAGRLFLVADEGDARTASERLGARRGEIYTAAEARRIIAVGDPSTVAEIHDFKRRLDGLISMK